MSEAAAALSDPAPATEAAVTPPAGNGADASPAQIPDYARDWEPEVAAWVGKKGYKAPSDVAKAYHSLERLYGQDKAGRAIVLPGEGADPKEWEQVYTRLGRPADPSGYGLQPAEGDDGKVADALATAMHKAGLTPTQAQAIHATISELATSDSEAEDNARAERSQSEHQALKREWGPKYDEKRELGRRAVRAMGITTDDLVKIENAVGTKFLMEKFAALGEAMREDVGVGQTALSISAAVPSTPEAARGRLKERELDSAFMGRVANKDRAAEAEYDALSKVAYGN